MDQLTTPTTTAMKQTSCLLAPHTPPYQQGHETNNHHNHQQQQHVAQSCLIDIQSPPTPSKDFKHDHCYPETYITDSLCSTPSLPLSNPSSPTSPPPTLVQKLFNASKSYAVYSVSALSLIAIFLLLLNPIGVFFVILAAWVWRVTKGPAIFTSTQDVTKWQSKPTKEEKEIPLDAYRKFIALEKVIATKQPQQALAA
ncbi:hypothetical protein BC829DRAFT_391067 [Chytridium lagenaria]|nr:hypothetical protein BC829DRAFT_391067 [Chytridium lagenaria]